MSDYTKVVKSGKEIKGVIDDGTKEIPIENKFGKLICKVYVRPGDLSIIDRYENVTARIADIVKPLEQLSLKNDGSASMDQDWEVLKQVQESLYKEINYLFDMDEAEEIFATRNPFSAVNGRFFCESVIEVIGDIIGDTITEEAEKVQSRTEKYLKDMEKQPGGSNPAAIVPMRDAGAEVRDYARESADGLNS